MPNLKKTLKSRFDRHWGGQLSEYITGLAWSPDHTLAVSSAAGEVVLWRNQELIRLQKETGQSIDCLAFSIDGRFLAAGGQAGIVTIWDLTQTPVIIANLDCHPVWIDKMAWSPTCSHLAFSLAKYVQIWDAETQNIVVTLPFEASSVLGLAWRSNGQQLAVAGDRGVKVWDAQNWYDDPFLVDLPAASIAVAWSGDGQFLASGSLDRTITVLRWGMPDPWVMRGFPGKIRCLAWSEVKKGYAPLLAASSVEGIAVWRKGYSDDDGWDAQVLNVHEGVIQGLAFQPQQLLLASAGDDGIICLWKDGKQLLQILEGTNSGFSSLAWNRTGELLAAGGQAGELMLWSPTSRGRGFQ